LCRFVSVDPIAEDFPHLSSYNYASNRPITARDLEGLQAEGEQNNSSTPSSGNTEFDRQAQSAIETFGSQEGYSIDIVHNLGSNGELQSGSISVTSPEGKSQILNFDKSTGFSDGEGNSVDTGGTSLLGAAGDVATGGGLSTIQAAEVRANYTAKSAELKSLAETGSFSDKQKGTRLRNEYIKEARKITPEPYRSMATEMKGELKYNPEGRFWKTNESVNSQMKTAGRVSKGLVAVGIGVSIYNIYNATDKRKQFAVEAVSTATTWAGAVAGAEVGAALGLLAGPLGGIVGGVVGGIAGAIIAGYLTDVIMSIEKPIDPVIDQDPYNLTLPSDYLTPQRFNPRIPSYD